MEVIRRHIVKHIDGYPVNIRYEPVKSIHYALKLTPDEFERLMTSYHKPEDRTQYYLQPIETIHREVNENEREHESL